LELRKGYEGLVLVVVLVFLVIVVVEEVGIEQVIVVIEVVKVFVIEVVLVVEEQAVVIAEFAQVAHRFPFVTLGALRVRYRLEGCQEPQMVWTELRLLCAMTSAWTRKASEMASERRRLSELRGRLL
jgi:hypothetical protein